MGPFVNIPGRYDMQKWKWSTAMLQKMEVAGSSRMIPHCLDDVPARFSGGLGKAKM